MPTENMPDGTHGRDIPGSSRRDEAVGRAMDAAESLMAGVWDKLESVMKIMGTDTGGPEDTRTVIESAISYLEDVQVELDEAADVLDRVIDE